MPVTRVSVRLGPEWAVASLTAVSTGLGEPYKAVSLALIYLTFILIK